VREGALGKVNKHGKLQERWFMLFNDVLLYTKAQLFKKTTYQYKGHIELENCAVTDRPDDDLYTNAFELQRIDKKKKYVICFNTPQEKAIWMKGRGGK
jgi:hypothetical protein